MDDATGELGGNGTEISDLDTRKNGDGFAISKMSELPPRGGNSDIDTVYFTLPFTCTLNAHCFKLCNCFRIQIRRLTRSQIIRSYKATNHSTYYHQEIPLLATPIEFKE